jgi:hypothetical protein
MLERQIAPTVASVPSVRTVWASAPGGEPELLRAGMLCSDAVEGRDGMLGDPTETALHAAAIAASNPCRSSGST